MVLGVVSPGRGRQPNRPQRWGAVPCLHLANCKRGGACVRGVIQLRSEFNAWWLSCRFFVFTQHPRSGQCAHGGAAALSSPQPQACRPGGWPLSGWDEVGVVHAFSDASHAPYRF